MSYSFRLSVVILLCFFASTSSYAQKVVKINFETKAIPDITAVNGIEEGDYYKIEVSNINLNLYKVTLQTRDSMIIPPQKTPDFALLGTGPLTGILSGITSLGSLSQLTVPNNPVSGLKGGVDLLVESRTPDPAQAKKIAAIKMIKAINKVRERMTAESKQIDLFKPRVTAIKKDIDDLLFLATYFQLKGKVEFQSDADYKALDAIAGNFDIATQAAAIQKVRNDISTLRVEIKQYSDKYNSFAEESANKALIAAEEELKKMDVGIKDAYTRLATAVDVADSLINPAKVNDMFTNIINQKNARYTYTSMPIQFKNDQAQISLTITPISPTSTLQTYSMPLVFPLVKKQYVGIGISFYGSGLYNDAYSILAFKRDTVVKDSIVKEKPGNGEFGMCALLQYGKKFDKCDFLGYHFSFGPGLSITNTVRARLLFGGGLSFGKKHMLVVNLGGIVGYVDRLSEALNTNTAYDLLPTTVTVSKLDVKFFSSIGYLYKF